MLRTTEFDAFGPWIYQVTTPDDIPRLFRSHPVDVAGALLILKVPRNIERRDADPTMDLYDRLLVADDGGLTVLTRVESTFTVAALRWEEIAAVSTSVDLLDGRLTLLSAHAPLVIPFNGSSQESIIRLVELVRSRYVARADTAPIPSSALDTAVPAVETDLQNLHTRLLRTEPALRPVAAQQRASIRSADPRPVVRALWNLWPTALQSALYYADGRELVILHRRSAIARGFTPVHSIARTAVALDRGTRIEVLDSPRFAAVRIVVVHLDENRLELPFVAPSTAPELLTSMLTAQRS